MFSIFLNPLPIPSRFRFVNMYFEFNVEKISPIKTNKRYGIGFVKLNKDTVEDDNKWVGYH